jgi:hypothetical protein
MVMKAYYMSVATDMWGDVPFSQALLGGADPSPEYDTQSSIYPALIQMLSDAAGMFDANADDLGLGDVLYGGDVTQWEMLANSLQVRLLMRSSGRTPGNVAAAQALISGGMVFSSNADNATLTWVGDNSWSNPLYENAYIDGRDDHAISKAMTDMMNAGGFSSVMDPRLPIYANPNGSGAYEGQLNGSVEPSDFAAISRIGAAYRDDPTAPVSIMTYAEILFFQAEANQDKQAYLDAIAASHDHVGATADATYLADAGAKWDADWQKALGEQKWIALYGNGVEAYNEWRRLDYPVLPEAPSSVYPGDGIPVRLPYASTESLTNGTNQSAAISAQGLDVDQLFTKVWWDIN